MNDLLRLYDPEAVGADGYPPEWHQVKHMVREQAGHRCERCQHPYPRGVAKLYPRGEWTPCDERCTHGEPVRRSMGGTFGDIHEQTDVPIGETVQSVRERFPMWLIMARWRILTVHHLDGNKWNLLWWNLAALCQRCHLEIQGKVDLVKPWPWEHSEWFRVHAAGWYAFRYLARELDRAEVERRLDELLAIGARHDAVERMPL